MWSRFSEDAASSFGLRVKKLGFGFGDSNYAAVVVSAIGFGVFLFYFLNSSSRLWLWIASRGPEARIQQSLDSMKLL